METNAKQEGIYLSSDVIKARISDIIESRKIIYSYLLHALECDIDATEEDPNFLFDSSLILQEIRFIICNDLSSINESICNSLSLINEHPKEEGETNEV